jgi:hypothetical protein
VVDADQAGHGEVGPGYRREPTADDYDHVRRFGPGEAITPLVDAAPVDVAALLGR